MQESEVEGTPSATMTLLRAHACVSEMVEAVRVEDYAERFVTACSRFIQLFDVLCKHNGLNLWTTVQLKMTYNETRPHLHGGKLA